MTVGLPVACDVSCLVIGPQHRKWARLGMSDLWWWRPLDQSGLASSKIATSLLYSSGKLLQPELELVELSIILNRAEVSSEGISKFSHFIIFPNPPW